MNTIDPITIQVENDNLIELSITFNKYFYVTSKITDEDEIVETHILPSPSSVIKLLTISKFFSDMNSEVSFSYKSLCNHYIFFDTSNYDYSRDVEEFKSSLLLCLELIQDEHTLLLGINEEQRKAASIITKQAKKSLYDPNYKLCQDVMKTKYDNSF
jgi:hypothetical protein